MTRGIKYSTDMLIDSLSANFLPYKTPNGDLTHVQLAVRPVKMFELVFPKECLPNVLKGVGYSPDNDPKLKLQRTILRKALNAQKIPDLDLKDIKPIFVNAPFCAIYPIGIKEDGTWKSDGMDGAELL